MSPYSLQTFACCTCFKGYVVCLDEMPMGKWQCVGLESVILIIPHLQFRVYLLLIRGLCLFNLLSFHLTTYQCFGLHLWRSTQTLQILFGVAAPGQKPPQRVMFCASCCDTQGQHTLKCVKMKINWNVFSTKNLALAFKLQPFQKNCHKKAPSGLNSYCQQKMSFEKCLIFTKKWIEYSSLRFTHQVSTFQSQVVLVMIVTIVSSCLIKTGATNERKMKTYFITMCIHFEGLIR